MLAQKDMSYSIGAREKSLVSEMKSGSHSKENDKILSLDSVKSTIKNNEKLDMSDYDEDDEFEEPVYTLTFLHPIYSIFKTEELPLQLQRVS